MNRCGITGMKRFFQLLWCLPLLAAFAAPGWAGEGHGDESHAEAATGPHGGRLLLQDDFAIEVTIYENGVPPEFRLYAYRDGVAVKPADVTAQIELARLGGRREHIAVKPEADSLRGVGVVAEPHSFDVSVRAGAQGKNYQWQYESYEGRTTIAARAAAAAGIETTKAGPAVLHETVALHGRLAPVGDRLYRVAARYAGIVQSVAVQVGDRVDAGQVLATVENSDSLQRYAVKAPAAGLVLERRVNPGDAAGSSEPLLVIADLSRLWVELAAFPAELARIDRGQPLRLRDLYSEHSAEAVVDWIAATVSAPGQAAQVRAVLDNGAGRWRAGQQVAAEVVVERVDAPLAVRADAIQQLGDNPVVFVRVGEIYEARPIETGRSDGAFVEVRSGLETGAEYVVRNSFVVKADVLKSGASHDH